MTDSSTKSDRLKLLLIPGLGLVLLYVLLDGSKQPGAAVELLSPPVASTTAKASSKSKHRQVRWPNASLTAIISHNPFELKDPRVMLDIAFAEAGITDSVEMTEVSADEFFSSAEPQLEVSAGWPQVLSFLSRSAPEIVEISEQESPPHFESPKAPTVRRESFGTVDVATAGPMNARTVEVSENQRLSRLQQRLTQLQTEPVRMIMKTRHGNSALLGTRKITEGELLEDGIRIAGIDRAGITFEIVERSQSSDLGQPVTDDKE